MAEEQAHGDPLPIPQAQLQAQLQAEELAEEQAQVQADRHPLPILQPQAHQHPQLPKARLVPRRHTLLT